MRRRQDSEPDRDVPPGVTDLRTADAFPLGAHAEHEDGADLHHHEQKRRHHLGRRGVTA